MYWVIPQMPIMATAKPGQRQEATPGLLQVRGTQVLGAVTAASRDLHWQPEAQVGSWVWEWSLGT